MSLLSNNPAIGPVVIIADNVTFKLRNEAGNTVIVEVCDDNASWVAINTANVFRAGGAAVGAASFTGQGQFYILTDNAYVRLRVTTYAGGVVELIGWEATTYDPRTDTAYLPHNIKTTAAGTTSGTATLLDTSGFADVNNVASGTGVRLPAEQAKGKVYTVKNTGANALSVYPPSGSAFMTILGYSADQPHSVPAGSYAQFDSLGGAMFNVMDHGQQGYTFPN